MRHFGLRIWIQTYLEKLNIALDRTVWTYDRTTSTIYGTVNENFILQLEASLTAWKATRRSETIMLHFNNQIFQNFCSGSEFTDNNCKTHCLKQTENSYDTTCRNYLI